MVGLGAFAARRRVPVTIVFIAIYGGVILLWPFEPTRFALAGWPILSALFVAGVRMLWVWRPAGLAPRAVRLVGAAAVVLVCAGYAVYNMRGVRDKWWVGIQRDGGTRAKPVAEWIARSTRPDDVVITDHDLIVYLYTGRRAVPTASFTALGRITPLTAAQDAEVLRSLLDRYRPRWYIAATRQSIDAATPLLNAPARLRLAGTISSASVYEPISP
jgi:hypothetical protein